MGRAPCCAKVGLHRGPWTPREDTLLTNYIQAHGEGHWKYLPKKAGLLRCGKSCRLRWMNYLRPDIKRGNITPDEDDLIIRLHTLLGNRWSLIAGRLPGRTDNEIKNYWNTHLSKNLRNQGTDPNSNKRLSGRAQDPKKRKNNSKLPDSKKKKHHIKNMQKANNVESEMKPKIHLPKPTRFTPLSLPRIDSFECKTVSGSSSHAFPGGDHDHHAGGILLFDTEGAGDVPCTTNFKETSDAGVGLFFVGGGGDGDEDHDLFNGSDLECQSQIPAADNTLEKLYEEYLQLLKTQEEEADQVQLDSFAESLFI